MRSRYLTISIASVLTLPAAALAQVDTSEWKCELCPFEDRYTSEVDVGAMFVSDSAARFGNATGLDEAGAEVDLNGDGRYANDNFQLRWSATDLALDSREIDLEAGSQGRYGVYLHYSELPYRLFDTTSTVYTAVGDNALTLPSGWVAAGQTTRLTQLDASLEPRDIGSDRQAIGIGGNAFLAGIEVFADYRHEEREGVGIVSGSIFSQATFLPRVIDYQTDTVDLGVRYANGPLNLALAWYGSFFQNQGFSLTWDSPYFNDPLTPGFEPRRLALEPDNDFQQVSLSGSYRAAALDTVVAFNAAFGQGEQDEPLLPYTVNPNIAANALPRSSLDGKVDTATYSLTLTSRPIDKSRVTLSYRYDERDNQTPRDAWTRVITDAFASPEMELNTPYSFERTRLHASGEYRLFDNLRLSAGYERREIERDFQEVAEQTEDTGWGKARWRPADWLNIGIKGGSSKRDIDRYDETIAASFGQNPLLRKYNLAYRYREFGELTVNFSSPESPLSIGATGFFADDSYTESQFGLTNSEHAHVSFDIGWAISERASVYVTGGRETIDADQAGSEFFGDPDWLAFHSDTFSHYGGGIVLRELVEQADLTLDYAHTDGKTGIRINRTGVSADTLPDLESTLDSVRLKLTYRRSERMDVNVEFRYENFSTKDWALVGPDTIPTVLTLGAKPYDYGVFVFALSFRYLIGARDIAFPE